MTEEGVTLCVLVGAVLACDHSRTVPVKLYHIIIEHSYGDQASTNMMGLLCDKVETLIWRGERRTAPARPQPCGRLGS